MGNSPTLPPPLPNITIPEARDVDVQPYQPQGGGLNAGAGFAGKTGQIANIAGNFLTGWLAGKREAQKKKDLDAERQIAGSNYAWDMMSTQWANYVQQNGDPAQNAKELQTLQSKQNKTEEDNKRIQELTGVVQQGEQMKKAAYAVWQNRLNTYKQYAFPDQGAAGGKKKSVGQKLKGAVTTEQPHLIAQTILQGMAGVQDPTQLIQVDRNAKLKSEVEAETLKTQKKAEERQEKIDASVDKLTGLYSKYGADEKQWTPDARKEIEAARNELSIQTKGEPYQKSAEQMKTELMDQFLKDPNSVSDEKKQLLGIQVERPSTFSAQDASGRNYIVTYDPKTKTVSKVDTGIRGRPEESSYQRAMAGYKAQMDITQRVLKQAHPDWSDQQIAQVAAQSMLPANADAGTVDQQNYQRDRAISKVMDAQAKAEQKEGYGGPPLTAIWRNFVSNPNGQYQFNTQYLKPESVRSVLHPSTWFNPKEGPLPGGIPKSALPAYESQLRNMVIQELMKENKGMTFAQATRLLGVPLYEREGIAPISQPPGAPQAFAKPGEPTYTVKAPNGEVLATGIGKSQKSQLENDPDMQGAIWVPDDVHAENEHQPL